MDKNTYNPWLGLVPYSEDTDLSINPFKGREQQTKELYRMVSGNVITTLYGKSGVGKSSLLAAGLFPMLKSQHCIPFKIRLYTECQAGKSFAQHITDVLSPFATPLKGLKYKPLPTHSVDYLWRYMAFHSFQDKGKDVTPILVLDQFEELLRNRNRDALLLIKQIRKLLDDGLLPNGDAYKIRFRIVLSLREDDLYLLEDLLDSNSIDRMKLNRYRLGSVDKDGAREIIEMPGIEFADKEECIKRAVYYADPHNEGQISTLLLSLICFRAFNKAGNRPISPDDIGPDPGRKKESSVSPIEEFYDEVTRKLDNNEQKYLLDRSITDDGRRQSIEVNVLKGALSLDAFDRLTNEQSQYHIFTRTSGKSERGVYYELLHDQIAEAVYSKRQKWETQQRIRKSRIILTTIGILVALVLLACIFVPMRMRATTPLYHTHLKAGDTLPVPPKPYHVKGGKLIIEDINNLTMPDNDFNKGLSLIGIKNAKYIEVPGDILNYTQLCFPETDTLVLGNPLSSSVTFANIKTLFPNLKHLTLTGYKFGKNDTVCVCMPTLKSIELSGYDNYDARLYNGTVFRLRSNNTARMGVAWYPIITSKPSADSITYNPYDFGWGPVHNAVGILDFDVSHSKQIIGFSSDFKVRLVNTDSNKRTLSQDDYLPYLNKSQIISIDLPYIEDITDCQFNQCRFLRSVSMPDLKAIPQNAFSSDSTLKTVNFPSVNKVQRDAFIGCISLDSIYLPLVTEIWDQAFRGCSSLSEIVLPNVKEIKARAFAYCTILQDVDIPIAEAISDWAFEGCSSLQALNIPNVKSFNANCLRNTACTEVVVPKLITLIGAKDLTNDERKSITIHIPNFNLQKNDTTALPFNVIQHNENELETLSKELNKKLETKYRNGYNIRGTVLTITDSIVPHLVVPRQVRNIVLKNRKASIRKFTVDPRNKYVRKRYKLLKLSKPSSLYDHIYKDTEVLPFASDYILEASPNRCKCLVISDSDPSYISLVLSICANYNGEKKYELLVPYGKGYLFEGLKGKPQFKSIREMGWAETIVRYILELADFRSLPILIVAIILSAISMIICIRLWTRRKWIRMIWPSMSINIIVGSILFIAINVSLLKLTSIINNTIVVFAFLVWLTLYSLAIYWRHILIEKKKNDN